MKTSNHILASGLLLVSMAYAQQPDHGAMHDMPGDTMSSSLLPSLPMTRDGSGTSWIPDTSPMHAVHAGAHVWVLMFHGLAFLRYTSQDAFESGARGESALDAPNWFMAMAQHRLGDTGRLGLRGMVSLDPLTEGGHGYPLLFQTGETFEGEPLIDRQHPHDLFMELATIYGRDLSRDLGFFAYFGYPGEPALGPTSFPHRPSARHNPDAPLGHHWQDATHISFGVATLGLRFGDFKLDGSVFTGREPNEERYGFDRPRFDSYAARLTANPNDRLSFQVSRGFLKSPEVLEPEQDLWRTTASIIHNNPFPRQGNWATTLLWGMNEATGGDDEDPRPLHSLLLESDLQVGPQVFYTRLDWVEKPAHDLALEEQFGEDRFFHIGSATFGAARDLIHLGGFKLMAGAQGILYKVPSAVQPLYGDNPVSLEVFLRLSPTLMIPGGRRAGGAHQMHQL